MPYADPEQQRAAQRRHYERNAALYKRRGANFKRAQRGKAPKYRRLPERAPTILDAARADGLLSTTDVARQVGCHPSNVKGAIRRGELQVETTLDDGSRLMTPEQVGAWQARRPIGPTVRYSVDDRVVEVTDAAPSLQHSTPAAWVWRVQGRAVG